MTKTISWEIKSDFAQAEQVSGLVLEKVHMRKAASKLTIDVPIMAIFRRPHTPNLPQRTGDKVQDSLTALTFLVDHLDEMLEQEATPIDLSDEQRYQMKVAVAEAFYMRGENATDDIRLVEDKYMVIVYRLDSVKDFRKTAKGGFAWTWNI